MRAIYEEPWAHYPNEDVQQSCLALYEAEKAQGTEMAAIIGALQEHVELEEDRLSREREEEYRRQKEEERLQGAAAFRCRRRLRLDQARRIGRAVLPPERPGIPGRAGQGQALVAFSGEPPDDDGALLGDYQGRRDANKALESIAYSPETQW